MFVSHSFSSGSVSSNIELWGYTDYSLTFDYIKLSLWLSNTPTSWEVIEMSQFVTAYLKQYFTKMKQASRDRQIGHMLHVCDLVFEVLAGWQLSQV